MYLGPAFAICSADPSGHETLSAVSFLSFLFFFFHIKKKIDDTDEPKAQVKVAIARRRHVDSMVEGIPYGFLEC